MKQLGIGRSRDVDVLDVCTAVDGSTIKPSFTVAPSTYSNIFGSRPSDHYFPSVCLSVCLFVCLFMQFFSAVFDLISIKLGHMLYVWV